MPDLVGRIERDPFSASLSTLSHNLRVLELRGLVDLGCFERYEGDDLPWPNLESLMVMFWPVCPSGSWYFQGPKGEGRHTKGYLIAEQHYPTLLPNTNDFVHDEYLKEHGRPGDNLIGGIGFRVRPNEETLVPFLTAFAKAAVRMPKLKDLNLWSPLIWYNNEDDIPADWLEYEHLNDRPLAWGLAYDKPTAKTPRKLTWRVSTWRPDDQLHTLFQDIGRQEHGNELVEDWVDEQYGDNLVGREFFSDYEVLPSHSLPWH
ncbi:hypothetical protein N0V86_003269 [Didymella sp. IMI 355093]|nr:hypothetical protein N0V86_003269 [Didymella sp. IMI 355093]